MLMNASTQSMKDWVCFWRRGIFFRVYMLKLIVHGQVFDGCWQE